MQFTKADHVFLIQSARSGNAGAMEALLKEYDDLIHSIARRYAGQTPHREQNLPDFLQDARLAFMRAVHGFDLSCSHSKLRSYAGRSMENECKDQSRFYLYPYTIPQRANDRRLRLHRVERDLQARLGREPLAEEIAAEADLTVEEVETALTLPSLVFLNHPIAHTGRNDAEPIYPQIPVTDDETVGILMWRALLKPCLSLLEPKQQVIIEKAFMEGVPQREIAETLNLSELHVSRLKHRALRELRQMIGGEAAL
jgi:RNA polymerase sigma-B factor